jgi:serine/threonine protein kinase
VDHNGRSIALRFLDPSVAATPDLLAAVAADVKAAAAFADRHVAKVLALVRVDGRAAIVGELVQGKSLAEPLASGARMNVTQVHGLGRVLAQTLVALHAAGLVHGSVQPSNVVVAGGLVKLTDLGLGRLAQRRPPAQSYRMAGLQYDRAGDLYDLATLLYHLLTGVHPRSLAQGAALPLPSTYTPATPEAMDRLLVRCLHPRADLRLDTAEAVLAELKDMVKIG